MRNADYAILAAILAVALGITAAMVLRPAYAEGAKPERFGVAPSEQSYEPPKAEAPAVQDAQREPEEPGNAVETEPEPSYEQAYEPIAEASAYTEPAGTYSVEYDPMYNVDGPTRDMPGWHDGYVETYYNASAHFLASTWTLDNEGFYHDENGRYVVGVEVGHADEMPYGTVVMTGKGEGAVYDYGSGVDNVHDFATNWS